MFNERAGRSKLDVVLHALRRQICLAPPDEELRLHENALAAEFEMSRTPIRQVLQRLAYEHLVETRSGVGTIATPLRREDRARDLQTHRGLLEAVLAHRLRDLSLIERSGVAALGAVADQLSADDRQIPFEARSELLSILRSLIADPILGDALQASHWRVIRWHMRDFVENGEAAAAALRGLLRSVAARTGSAEALFRAVLENDLSS